MFTGDASGDFLYPALHRAGFASQPFSSSREDSLQLSDLFISAVCRCVPPDNKPLPQEMVNCHPFLVREFNLLPVRGIVALGKFGYEHSIRLLREKFGKQPNPPSFGHHVLFNPGEDIPWVLASYHPSRQNTQTGRLTKEMFDEIWQIARELLK
jgi:uracil-DNA glycosylase family 4